MCLYIIFFDEVYDIGQKHFTVLMNRAFVLWGTAAIHVSSTGLNAKFPAPHKVTRQRRAASFAVSSLELWAIRPSGKKLSERGLSASRSEPHRNARDTAQENCRLLRPLMIYKIELLWPCKQQSSGHVHR